MQITNVQYSPMLNSTYGVPYRVYHTDGILEIADIAEQVHKKGWLNTEKPFGTYDKWVGAKFSNWDQFRDRLLNPTRGELDQIRRMSAEVRKEIPEPQSVRRVGRWNDVDGEIDADRGLRGEPEMFRNHVRQRRTSILTATIVVPMSVPGSVDSHNLLWRGAAALSAADVLEDAGYSIEIVGSAAGRGVWCRGDDDFKNATVTIPLKAIDAPLDISSLIGALSGWFYRLGILQVYSCEKRADESLGLYDSSNSWTATTSPEGDKVVSIGPKVLSHYDAIDAARSVISKISDPD